MGLLDEGRAIVRAAADEADRLQALVVQRMHEQAASILNARLAGVDDGKPKTIEGTVATLSALLVMPGVRDEGSLVRATVLPLVAQVVQHGYGLACIEDRLREYEALLESLCGGRS